MPESLDVRAKRIIDDLLDTSDEFRSSAIQRACGADEELAGRVQALLAAIRQDDGFLGDPTVDNRRGSDSRARLEKPGATIGPYKLLQVIGEGGMGIVYMAEQIQPVQRRVALKIIKPGMDSNQVIARFEAERQALAMMDHQNIARVLDAGTTASGRPFFVMELIHGVPITQFCDERRLAPRERLELFVPICQAIQHAHQKGVIHRDIKPTNVLVTMYDNRPVPKVIDFGVAKATEQRLTDRTMFTHFGALIGTAQYMSPEQAEINAFGVDTRSDIYSLGVLLYELLTGTTPLDAQHIRKVAQTEVVRLIKEEEAPRPSIRLSTLNHLPRVAADRGTEATRLSSLIRGDVDWIVMKCLEKDRTRRYDSANGLARDIQRHLADEPVEACPPSAAYRTRKFVRRYRTPLVVGCAFLVVLIAGAVTSTWEAVRAMAAEKIAVRNEGTAIKQKEAADAAKLRADEQRDELAKLNEQLRMANYVTCVSLAQSAWEQNNLERFSELMESLVPAPGEPDLRGFEWSYLSRLSKQARWNVRAHPGGARSVTYQPDGRRLLSSGFTTGYKGMNLPLTTPGEIKCWDADTGRELPFALNEPPNQVWNLALSPDGTRLAAGCGSDGVRVWNLATGVLDKLECPAGEVATNVTFSADGQRLAARTKGAADLDWNEPREIRIWDLVDRKPPLIIDKLSYFWSPPAFSPDGRWLVYSQSSQGGIHVLDTTTGTEAYALNYEGGMIGHAIFSPDGNRLVTSGEKGIQIWDVTKRERVSVWPVESTYGVYLAFNRTGNYLAQAGVEGIIEIWEFATGRKLKTLKGHAGSIESIEFSPDGLQLASVGSDGTLRVWDLAPSQSVALLPQSAGRAVNRVFDPSGRTALQETTSGNLLQIVELPDGRPIGAPFKAEGLEFYDWDATGKRLVVPDMEGYVNIFDVSSGSLIQTFKSAPAELYIAALSPDGRQCAHTDPNGVIRIRDLASDATIQSIDDGLSTIHNLAFSPDGKWLAAADVDGRLRVFELSTGARMSETQLGDMYIDRVLFNPDGTRLIAKGVLSPQITGEVRIIDPIAGGVLRYLRGHTLLVADLDFSPDGRRVATASSDRTVRIWDFASGQELLTLRGHAQDVLGVRFRDGGRRLMSVSADGEVRYWDGTPLDSTVSPPASSQPHHR